MAILATLAVLAPVAWFWQGSLVPGTYSVMDMGYADYGGGPRAAAEGAGHPSGHVHGGIAVASLTGPPDGPPDVAVTLVARAESIRLAGGRTVRGYTLNHRSPGPEIRAEQGQLVQVRLVNESVRGGVSLHWHGVDVPNAEDGVAGVTQDAVAVGADHVYRFVADDAGTYWYHSHQVSHEQVRKGLFGTLVVTPKSGPASKAGRPSPRDVVAAVHTYDGQRSIGGQVGERRVETPSGSTVRVRLVNTDNGPQRAWVSGAPFRVVAVDARDLHGPTPVSGKAVLVTAGGRVDLAITTPASGAVRVNVGGQSSLVLGPAGTVAPGTREPSDTVDLLSYGTRAPIGFDPASADRRFSYRIGRRPGFLDGRPGLWWTINGHQFPDVPMFLVTEGDVVRMTVANGSGQVHPMHLHGHHAVVLSRDGKPATGSPWWVDSLNVEDGESYEIAFLADNPGIWVDHCHNLPHATEGLITHLAYTGVTGSYRVGGERDNQPE